MLKICISSRSKAVVHMHSALIPSVNVKHAANICTLQSISCFWGNMLCTSLAWSLCQSRQCSKATGMEVHGEGPVLFWSRIVPAELFCSLSHLRDNRSIACSLNSVFVNALFSFTCALSVNFSSKICAKSHSRGYLSKLSINTAIMNGEPLKATCSALDLKKQ